MEKPWFNRMEKETAATAIYNGKQRSNHWRIILFITLMFMRHYWTEAFGEFLLGIPASTIAEWIEYGQTILFDWAVQLIAWPNAQQKANIKIDVCGRCIVGVTDCCEQPLSRSTSVTFENQTFSGKYMMHTISLLAVVIHGKVLLLSDSHPGAKNDQQVLMKLSGLEN